MVKLLSILILSLLFSSNLSLANNNNKITIEIIDNIFFEGLKKYPFINETKALSEDKKEFFRKKRENSKTEEYKKRKETRGIARCRHQAIGSIEMWRKCNAKIIRAVLTYPEKSKKSRPGDIFFTLLAIDSLVSGHEEWKVFIKMFYFKNGDKPRPGMVCRETPSGKALFCKAFKKSTYKKIEKFRKDPTNEKLLGHKLTKYIKNQMMINNIENRLGMNYHNFAYVGDMLNDVVKEVRLSDINPQLKLQRSLLTKYVLLLNNLESKLNKVEHKKVEKEISKLSNSFIEIKNLQLKTNQLTNFDNAVNKISVINEIIIKSSLKAKDDFSQRNIAVSSIQLMKDLVDSILFTIPEKYYIETKGLSENLWTNYDLEQLEISLDKMMKKNYQIKSQRLNDSIKVINKNFQSVDVNEIIDSLEGLGFPNRVKNKHRDDTALDIANEAVRDNLNNEIFKKVRKTLQQIDTDHINELAKEASESATQIAKEVSNTQQTKSFLDRKIGNHSMRTLIGAHRRGYIDLGIGNR